MSKERSQPNPYKLTIEQLTMPEGGSHQANLAWVDKLAEFQIEGLRHGFLPQVPFMHPRYNARWRKVKDEYNKKHPSPSDEIAGDGKNHERHSSLRLGRSEIL